ncbi:hypothetical protein NS258_18340, partial [Sphingomonas sanguinis]
MNLLTAALLASAALVASPALAQTASPVPGYAPPAPVVAEPAPPLAPFPTQAPKLIVAIPVDQFSADLFAQYRNCPLYP